MRQITFTIPGRIGGKQRAGRKVEFRHDGKAIVRSFNPKQTASQEAAVRQIAALAMRGTGLMQNPVSVKIMVSRVPPKSWSEKKRINAQWVTGKPDVDNTQKLLFDALNGIVWVDDAQIACVWMRRVYIFNGPEMVEVEIKELEGA